MIPKSHNNNISFQTSSQKATRLKLFCTINNYKLLGRRNLVNGSSIIFGNQAERECIMFGRGFCGHRCSVGNLMYLRFSYLYFVSNKLFATIRKYLLYSKKKKNNEQMLLSYFDYVPHTLAFLVTKLENFWKQPKPWKQWERTINKNSQINNIKTIFYHSYVDSTRRGIKICYSELHKIQCKV